MRVDAEFGHPFLAALYRKRAIREARRLRGQWSAFDTALDKPALRERLEKKYGTTDATALKQAMLAEALQREPFLKSWLVKQGHAIEHADLLATLREASAMPAASLQ